MTKIFISPFLLLFCLTCGYAQYSFDRNTLIQDIKILSADSLEGRKVGSEGGRKARNYIIKRLIKAEIKPFYSSGYEQPFTYKVVQERTASNIIAIVEGKKSGTFVLSAHYDHVGVINNSIYNGADDNASGTAALLSVATYFKNNPPEHRLIIAFFDAEESGLRGSEHFANSIDLRKENILLNVNLDMVSRSDNKELYASGTYYYPHLRETLQNLELPQNISLLFGHDDPSKGRSDWTNQSDQKNFHKRGIPFIYFGVEDHPDYHKPTDTFDKIDQTFYSNSTETILRAIKALDKDL